MSAILQWLALILRLLNSWLAPKPVEAPPAPKPVFVPDTRDESKVDVVIERDKTVDEVRSEVAKTAPLVDDLDALIDHAKRVGTSTMFIVLALTLAGQTRLARADDFPAPTDIRNEPAGDDEMIKVKRGLPAPIDGVIFDAPTLLRWTNWRTQASEFRIADMTAAKKWCQVETAFLARQRDAEHEARVADVTDLRTQLTKAQTPRAWWDYPAVGFLSGIIVAGAFIALGEGLRR